LLKKEINMSTTGVILFVKEESIITVTQGGAGYPDNIFPDILAILKSSKGCITKIKNNAAALQSKLKHPTSPNKYFNRGWSVKGHFNKDPQDILNVISKKERYPSRFGGCWVYIINLKNKIIRTYGTGGSEKPNEVKQPIEVYLQGEVRPVIEVNLQKEFDKLGYSICENNAERFIKSTNGEKYV